VWSLSARGRHLYCPRQRKCAAAIVALTQIVGYLPRPLSLFVTAVLALGVALAAPGDGALSPDVLVDAMAVIPSLQLDIRYASANNFTGAIIYPQARCLLRLAVALRLRRVQESLAERGLGLKVFDCYRPQSAQRKLWSVLPDRRYVADPRKGSRHSRGAAVDLTLVTAGGAELAMPTAFDVFTVRAHRRFRNLSGQVLRNRAVLEAAMMRAGFIPTSTEWWHFDAPDWRRYPISDEP
jgi:zinc D-Ala-D-Ala dipeptidase